MGDGREDLDLVGGDDDVSGSCSVSRAVAADECLGMKKDAMVYIFDLSKKVRWSIALLLWMRPSVSSPQSPKTMQRAMPWPCHGHAGGSHKM